MSLEIPSFRPPVNPSSTPISRISSPSPSISTLVMAASTHSTPHSNTNSGPIVSPPPLMSPSSDWSRSRSPNTASSEAPSEETQSLGSGDGNVVDMDRQIIEALKGKDRLYVLKLGEQMENLINERKARIDINPSTSYQRMLVHRCSAFYKLSPENDPTTKSIIVTATLESRIPGRKICELVPAESTAQPAFKIMRRTANDRPRSKPHSQAGSVAGDDGDLSDVEPSESGSLGGRSNPTGISKKRMTIEEREAAYNEARSRIFMGFEEKEKDTSGSSSTQSLVSGSASTSGGGRGSSIDDIDDSISTLATESEWSGPAARDRKDTRHNTSGTNPTGPRSLRSSAPPFNVNGSNSSRGSRASSPAFTYASLYEPPPPAAPYDSTQALGKAPTFVPQYPYSYSPQGPVPQNQQAYSTTYPTFPPYAYPPQNSMPNSDPSSPDVYHHAPYVQYPGSYVWPHPHQAPPPTFPMQHPPAPSQHNHQGSNHGHIPSASGPPFTPPYMHSAPPYGSYPAPGYYPPQPGQQQIPPTHPQMLLYSPETRSMNGLGGGGGGGRNGHDSISANHSRTSSRNGTGHGPMNGGGKRGAPPARSAWSYGPGVSMGGFGYGNPGGMGGGSNDVVGPRLSSVMRRTSQTSSVSSSSAGNRTPAGDEASSTASSSTTSSSSRRTYTSTTSSQHPLPPRPDWAVGLKPQPTLHSSHSRHHDNSMGSSRSSPGRSSSQPQPSLHPPPQPIMPVVLQSTDFPPLSLSSPPEKRIPVAGGAWTDASSTRSILMPTSGHVNSQNNASLHQSTPNNVRLDESDHGFERPPPKSNAELFNPKNSRRPNSGNSRNNSLPQEKVETEKEGGGDAVANLVDQVTSLSVGDVGSGSPSAIKVVAAVATST